jgi:hypothetical protein
MKGNVDPEARPTQKKVAGLASLSMTILHGRFSHDVASCPVDT